MTKTKTNSFNENKSPLRYPGGKSRAVKILNNIFIAYFKPETFTTVFSPFVGGSSFEFFLQNNYGFNLILNDKFKPLANFWLQVKHDCDSLCNNIEKYPIITKEMFKKLRSEILFESDPIKQATSYFIINRCSFSGATLSGGFSEESSKLRYTKSSINRIRKLNFDRINIFNEDFSNFLIDNIIKTPDDIQNYFIFLDPPYYLEKKSKLYGANGDLHVDFEHNKLKDILTDIDNRCSWLLTYNNCDFIRELYKDYIILDVDWKYGMNTTKKSSEIVILSIKK